MKKFTGFCLLWLMLSARSLYAQSGGNKLHFDITDGYQRENFHWSIAGNSSGQNPNVFSELKWTKLAGQSIAASLQYNVYQKFNVYADYTRQFITSGTVNDSDYSTMITAAVTLIMKLLMQAKAIHTGMGFGCRLSAYSAIIGLALPLMRATVITGNRCIYMIAKTVSRV
jgi:hypothetical protein